MYSLIFENPAEKFIKKLDKTEQVRLIKKIEELRQHSDLGKPLVGTLVGLRSLRIGDYRVIYTVRQQELVILVLKIGHKKNVYD